MRFSSRFFLYGPVSLFVILAVAVSVQWWREADAWTKKIDALNGHEIAQGITLHFASRQLTGFPFRVDTIFRDVRISFAGPRALQWRAEHFALHRLSYGSGKTVFEAGGQQSFSWRGHDGTREQFSFLPGSIRADAITRDGRLARFDLVLVALDAPKVTAGRVEVHLRHDPKIDALDLVAFASDLSLPAQTPAAYAKIDTRITGAHFLNDLLSGNADWRTVLESWRARGHIDLVEVQTKGKGAAADTEGRASIGADHTLTGSLSKEMFGVTAFATPPLY